MPDGGKNAYREDQAYAGCRRGDDDFGHAGQTGALRQGSATFTSAASILASAGGDSAGWWLGAWLFALRSSARPSTR